MLRASIGLACSVLSVSVLASCTQPLDERAGSESSAAQTLPDPEPPWAPRPGDRSGPRFNAYVGTAGCRSIAGSGGTWRASPTFPGDGAFCEYWWADKTVADRDALFRTLQGPPYLTDSISEDFACELLMEVIDAAWTCERPAVGAYDTDPGSGGGQYTCRSCIRASSEDSGEVDVLLPESLVTYGPSSLTGIFGGTRFVFSQPGRVSTFRVSVPDTNKATLASLRAAPVCRGVSVVAPWSQIGGPGCDEPGEP